MDDSKVLKNEVIYLHHLATKPRQARSIVWCSRVNRFVQKVSKNHKPLRLDIETLHDISLNIDENSMRKPKEPITKQDKRLAVDNTNCPNPEASVTSPTQGCTGSRREP